MKIKKNKMKEEKMIFLIKVKLLKVHQIIMKIVMLVVAVCSQKIYQKSKILLTKLPPTFSIMKDVVLQ